jgi:hypothetical protein
MAIILLSCDEFRLIIKLFYNSENVINLLNDTEKRSTDEIIKQYSLSVKELLSSYFERFDFKVSHIQPVITRGFDEILLSEKFRTIPNNRIWNDFWKLSIDPYFLTYSSTLEIVDPSVMSRFRKFKNDLALFMKAVDHLKELI